jgi:C4-dicarboxylate-specific signal transduction histidine kinase
MESRFRGLSTFQEETKFVTLDGREIDVLFTAARLESIGGRGIGLVGAIDITDRIRAQERFQQVQADFAHAARLSVLGEIAASIAHEVNQPLAAVMTNGETGLRWLDRPEPNVPKARELMERILNDAGRAADIIARIRVMATGRAPQQTALALHDVIAESMLFLRHELQSKGVSISLELAPALPQVTGDRTQLNQVVVNLVINAVQAMVQSGKGRRSISIRTMLSDPETVCCVVEDSGPGLDPTHLTRLFDSFFTTKHTGMGMGLSICRSIIEAHDGHIEADNKSALGGARFSFALPANRASAG